MTDIPLSLIDPFPDHPFHVRDDDDMADLVASVASVGILTPLTVRPKEDRSLRAGERAQEKARPQSAPGFPRCLRVGQGR